MKRWLGVLMLGWMLGLQPTLAGAQALAVAYRDTITVPVPGAVAAFSLNSFFAEARVDSEELIIFGKNPGSAHIVVVTHEDTKTFEVRILPNPPSHPPGFVPPLSAAAARENGSYETRFTSNPSQLENILDSTRREGDRSVTVHLAGTLLVTPEDGRSTFEVTSASYQIISPARDVTVLDQLVVNSPLTVDGSIVRGFHLREGNFLFHGGYTSTAAFENLIFPTQKEGVVGIGYRFAAGSHAFVMPNFYYFSGSRSSENYLAAGGVASVLYDYQRGKNLELLAETGFSRGLAEATRFHSYTAHDQVIANLRYEPIHFAAIGLNNLHGLYSNFDWTRYVTSRLTSTVTFSGNHYNLRALNMTNVVADLNLQFQLSRHWLVVSGIDHGSSESRIPVGPSISTVGLPASIGFDSRHLQSSFLYQYSAGSGAVSRSEEIRMALGTHWGGFRWQGYVDRQTQAISIAFGQTGTPGLQDALETLGVSATTPEQIALALSETAGLVNQKLIPGIKINVSPVRLQASSDLAWSNHAHSRQRLDFRLLYNQNDLQEGEERTTIGTFSYSVNFKNVNELFASVSLFRGGMQTGWNSPIFEVSLRHQLSSVPNFLISRRRGNISGVVFADDGATGVYHAGGPLLPGVEVILDDIRRVRTDKRGGYLFAHVSYGSHSVEVVYRSAQPFFFTTASRVQSDVDAQVNFGIGLSFARLSGWVRSDRGIGLPAVELIISQGPKKIRAHTDSEGKFRVEGLSSGEYEVTIDPDSVPPGYSLTLLTGKRTTVDPSVPAHSEFTLNAIRNVSGLVTRYDPVAQHLVAVPGITVMLRELARECVADKNGIYLFRDLPPGTYSLVIVYQGKETKRMITVPEGPAFPRNVDINLVGN
jgi:hypothetical protein